MPAQVVGIVKFAAATAKRNLLYFLKTVLAVAVQDPAQFATVPANTGISDQY